MRRVNQLVDNDRNIDRENEWISDYIAEGGVNRELVKFLRSKMYDEERRRRTLAARGYRFACISLMSIGFIITDVNYNFEQHRRIGRRSGMMLRAKLASLERNRLLNVPTLLPPPPPPPPVQNVNNNSSNSQRSNINRISLSSPQQLSNIPGKRKKKKSSSSSINNSNNNHLNLPPINFLQTLDTNNNNNNNNILRTSNSPNNSKNSRKRKRKYVQNLKNPSSLSKIQPKKKKRKIRKFNLNDYILDSTTDDNNNNNKNNNKEKRITFYLKDEKNKLIENKEFRSYEIEILGGGYLNQNDLPVSNRIQNTLNTNISNNNNENFSNENRHICFSRIHPNDKNIIQFRSYIKIKLIKKEGQGFGKNNELDKIDKSIKIDINFINYKVFDYEFSIDDSRGYEYGTSIIGWSSMYESNLNYLPESSKSFKDLVRSIYKDRKYSICLTIMQEDDEDEENCFSVINTPRGLPFEEVLEKVL